MSSFNVAARKTTRARESAASRAGGGRVGGRKGNKKRWRWSADATLLTSARRNKRGTPRETRKSRQSPVVVVTPPRTASYNSAGQGAGSLITSSGRKGDKACGGKTPLRGRHSLAPYAPLVRSIIREAATYDARARRAAGSAWLGNVRPPLRADRQRKPPRSSKANARSDVALEKTDMPRGVRVGQHGS